MACVLSQWQHKAVGTYAHTYVRTYVRMYVCTYVHMYVRMLTYVLILCFMHLHVQVTEFTDISH